MKTYCWKCEKQTKIEKPVESERSRLLIRGFCEVCGINTSKTIARKMKPEMLI